MIIRYRVITIIIHRIPLYSAYCILTAPYIREHPDQRAADVHLDGRHLEGAGGFGEGGQSRGQKTRNVL